jgi:hypothetical protein
VVASQGGLKKITAKAGSVYPNRPTDAFSHKSTHFVNPVYAQNEINSAIPFFPGIPQGYLDANLVALAGIGHEAVVTAAVAAGLEVPPEVRREYPALFVEIPERFATGRFSAVERVQQALQPAPFQSEPVSVADVDRWIEQAHFHLATVRCERTRRVALNPDMAPDYDEIVRRNIDPIDFYRWLRRLVDVGGVFHVPAPAAADQAA